MARSTMTWSLTMCPTPNTPTATTSLTETTRECEDALRHASEGGVGISLSPRMLLVPAPSPGRPVRAPALGLTPMHIRITSPIHGWSSLALACICTIFAACDDQNREESAATAGTEELLLTRVDPYPCTLAFQPTGIVISADVRGSVPDPNVPVTVAPDGRFAMHVSGGEGISVWSQDGEFLQTISRAGEGPGEFGSSPLPMFDEHGLLHVFDPTTGRWSVFSTDGTFLHSVTSLDLAHVYLPGRIALISADSALISAPSPLSTGRHQFRILSNQGNATGFGDLPDGDDSTDHARPITKPRDGTFWAAPKEGASEYTLEEWSLDGRLLRRIRLDPPWDIDRDPDGGPPLPRFVMLAEGPSSQLIALAMVSAPDEADRDMNSDYAIEVWYAIPRQKTITSARILGVR